MKFTLGFGAVLFLVIGVGLILFWDKIKLSFSSTASAIGTAVNPLSDENLANRASNAIVQNITGDPNATLGTSVFNTVQSVKDWLIKTGTGVPDSAWLQPGVIEFCQLRKDQGQPLGSAACQWLNDNGYLVDNTIQQVADVVVIPTGGT